MKTIEWNGYQLNLPGNRLGSIQEYILSQLVARGEIGIRATLNLKGRAANYSGRYIGAIDNLVKANPHLIKSGSYGSKRGFGYKWIG